MLKGWLVYHSKQRLKVARYTIAYLLFKKQTNNIINN